MHHHPTPYTPLLEDSLKRFLDDPNNNPSPFRPIFSRLLHSLPDPPLEAIWFYAALHPSTPNHLLHLLVSLSASFPSPSKRVAALAPLVSDLFYLASQSSFDSESEELVEGVIGYLGVCKESEEEEEGAGGELKGCFGDVVRVWTVGRGGMEGFLPLVSEEVREEVARGDGGVRYLAGVVVVEVFFMMMFLKVKRGVEIDELRVSAVESLTAIGDRICFGILLKLLLHSTTPSVFVLNPKYKSVIRTILYDAVLLEEYSFLRPTGVEQFNACLNSLALVKAIVAHEAIQIAWKNGDQGKAISFINCFSRSPLISTFVKWLRNQSGMDLLGISNVSTPEVLLRWLLRLEEQGHVLFEHNILKPYRNSLHEFNLACEGQILKVAGKKPKDDLFFSDGKAGVDGLEDQEMESVDMAFASAVHSMEMEKDSNVKKRKGKQGEQQAKFVKYKLDGNLTKEYSIFQQKLMSNKIEVNPVDEDMEEA